MLKSRARSSRSGILSYSCFDSSSFLDIQVTFRAAFEGLNGEMKCALFCFIDSMSSTLSCVLGLDLSFEKIVRQ
jgi:hypothetical protein